MAYKIIVSVLLLVAATRALTFQSSPNYRHRSIEAEEYDPNAQYSFAYNVQDPITGDSKSQHESRDGDFVQGSYSLIEADGSKRTVDYTADGTSGFNAVVHKEGGVASPFQYAPATSYAGPVVSAARIAAPRRSFPVPSVVSSTAPLPYAAPVLATSRQSAPSFSRFTPGFSYSAPSLSYNPATQYTPSLPAMYNSAPMSYTPQAALLQSGYSFPGAPTYPSTPLTYAAPANIFASQKAFNTLSSNIGSNSFSRYSSPLSTYSY